MERQRLRIYLNDHLAGSTGGIQLAERILSENRDHAMANFLERLVKEIREDRETLRALIKELGMPENPIKQAGAWIAEIVGRLKMNDQLFGYSDLSRLIELEILSMGVEGKRLLWKALMRIRNSYPEINKLDLEALHDRAEKERQELETWRVKAAETALLEEP